MMKKEIYASPEFEVLNFGLRENVNTTMNDIISASNDVYEDDPFDI